MLRKRRRNVNNSCIIYHILSQFQSEVHARQLFITDKTFSVLNGLIQNYLQGRKAKNIRKRNTGVFVLKKLSTV